jgi:hypothetical protein
MFIPFPLQGEGWGKSFSHFHPIDVTHRYSHDQSTLTVKTAQNKSPGHSSNRSSRLCALRRFAKEYRASS